MKTIQITVVGLLLLGTYSCKETKKEADKVGNEIEQSTDQMEQETNDMMGKEIALVMESKSDSEVKGDVSFKEVDGEVMMTAEFSGLGGSGSHAIHLHENADCESMDGKSAGGHWNPTDQPHGKWGAEEGFHKGDIGNFEADAEGNATVEFTTDQWCIGCDDDAKNIVGRSVIVHKGTDDFVSQPSGDAGARVACTGIIQ